MREQLIVLVASICAGALVMILHEFPKALLFHILERKRTDTDSKEASKKPESKEKQQKLMSLHHYIDPIGLIFCVILRVGFSKPYYYRIRDKKLSRMLGLTGLISLLLQFLVSSALLRFVFGMDGRILVPNNVSFGYEFFLYLLSCYSIISIGMFLTNLFPIVAFDMGLLIASASPLKFYSIIRGDYLIKMVWLFTVLLGILNSISYTIFGLFMG